ncbi:hypothetical protein DMA15_17640 [Streptomyces sp. WAC 01529]|nr:hypothetical protein DMA15_17640 [Streptomyces sp. WAC 01529]
MGIPHRIEVIREGSVGRVLVDGTQLPFPIPREAITVTVHPEEIPMITLHLFAEQVEVRNNLHADTKETGR